MRLFSIILWHHFAYMMISVALLGYGAGGAFVALARPWLERHFALAFVAAAAAFGIAAPLCFEISQRIGFNPLELLWDPAQLAKLLAIYLALFVPFFAAATCICLAFTRFRRETHRIYAADIVGAGAGCVAILAALFAFTPSGALKLVAASGLLASASAAYAFGLRRLAAGIALAAAALPALAPSGWPVLMASEYKDLSQALRVKDARVAAEASSPLGLVTVVESPTVPLRHAPGLSLNATVDIPEQMGVFTDGDGPAALVRYRGRREDSAYLEQLTSALPYHLLAHPRVLVLGAGAGTDVLQAARYGALSIDAVELNPQIVDLVENRFASFSGKPFASTGTRVHVADARGFVAGTHRRFDLIQVALLDAFGVSSAGLHALSESYLYTVEGLRDYLRRLEPGGLLAITRWVSLPPRDTIRLFATARSALEADGVAVPAKRLALIRGWKTATLLVKNGDFTAAEISALKAFCTARSFDVAYYAGMPPHEANRFNVLGEPYFFAAAQALSGAEREAFIDGYKFDIAPATDDRPFFFHFFRWSSLAEILALKSRGGLPLLDWGYPILVTTLVQAVLAAAVLILVPLWAIRRRAGSDAPATARRARLAPLALYFLAVGFAFMFIEIACMQKFLLFLAHPLYATGVVLASFLVFAGIGSALVERLAARRGAGTSPLVAAVAIIAVLAAAYPAILPPVFRELAGLPDPARITVTALLIAPLATAMGMPFPLALARVAAHAEALIPWAWGVNACASVAGAIVATLLAIHAGFTAVLYAALALYALALAVFPRILGARDASG